MHIVKSKKVIYMFENKKVGFCRLDMTPTMGIEMNGYPKPRYADGVLDPLYLNAVAFGEGDKKAIMIVCDTLGCYGPKAYEWPKMLSKEFDIPEEAVFICHTHTHTGPLLSNWINSADDFYVTWFEKRLKDVTKMAFDDLKPVKNILLNETETKGINYNRRFLMKDGSYQTWAKAKDPAIERMEVEPDRTLRIIRFEREGGEEIVLINFQCHPDTIGGSKISADYPGILRKQFEEQKKGTKCVFLNGAEGNMTRVDYIGGTSGPKSYESVFQICEKLTPAAVSAYDGAKSATEDSPLSFARDVVSAPTKRDDSLVPECLRIKKAIEEERYEDIAPKKGDAIAIAVEANHIISLANMKKDFLDLNVSAIGFGPLALLGMPGEPFCELGIEIRGNSPFETTCVCCHTNGSEGYYPTDEAFDHGGYERRSGRLKKGAAPMLVNSAEKLLNGIYKK